VEKRKFHYFDFLVKKLLYSREEKFWGFMVTSDRQSNRNDQPKRFIHSLCL